MSALTSKAYLKMLITPDDPLVVQKVSQVVTNPLWPDVWELRDWVAGNMDYASDSELHGITDYWQFAREAMASGRGDCEDYSVLLVSLLRACGYGSDEVYVMTGYKETGGHAWVVVKAIGVWWTIEPQASTGEGILYSLVTGQLTEVSGYTAQYKFNDQAFYDLT
mgnify:CR=1 FL=1